ncbi:MAG: VCBS repeat-containing protein [Halioglobus sp.]|nr:VCBS repeat-containing protein [Halioglobus sp.]
MQFFRPDKICLAILLFLVVAEYGHAPNIYWQKWSIDASGNGADGVNTGDYNRDGLIDVVSGWEQSGEMMLYLNPGPDTVRETAAWQRVDISGGGVMEGIEDAAFADLDLDGFDDAILSSIESDTQTLGIHWLEGSEINEPGDWRVINLAPKRPAAYMKARAAQIDGVRGADIVAGSKERDGNLASIFWFKALEGASPGTSLEWRRFFVGEVDVKTVTLVIKDMDADGILDIVYAGRQGVGWFRNPGPEVLNSHPEKAVWERIVITSSGSEFTFCDHVIDGREDMIVATSHNSGMVAKWLKRLDATGRHWAEYPITSDQLRTDEGSILKFVIKGVACGYVDGDDQIDVVFTGSGHGHGVFMMSPVTDIPSGLTWDLVNLTPYANYMKYDNLRLIDMDVDGDLDVVTTEEGGGNFTRGEGVLWLENPLRPSQELSVTDN